MTGPTTKKGKGLSADEACMRGIGALKIGPDTMSGPLKERLDAMNAELKAIDVKKEGKTDWEKTLDARADAAKKMLAGDKELAGRCRFSYISGTVEERLI